MGFLFSKPLQLRKNQSTDTDDLFPSEIENAIINNDLEKVKELSKEEYNITDTLFLAAKLNRIEILKYLAKK